MPSSADTTPIMGEEDDKESSDRTPRRGTADPGGDGEGQIRGREEGGGGAGGRGNQIENKTI